MSRSITPSGLFPVGIAILLCRHTWMQMTFVQRLSPLQLVHGFAQALGTWLMPLHQGTMLVLLNLGVKSGRITDKEALIGIMSEA